MVIGTSSCNVRGTATGPASRSIGRIEETQIAELNLSDRASGYALETGD